MQTTRAGRVGALDVHNCAERRVWNALPDRGGTSVSMISYQIGFTPQYTRKVLALLQDGDLAKTKMRGPVAVWTRCGEVGAVLRHVKQRSEPSGARSRRALCLRVWRLLHKSAVSLDADGISKRLATPSPEIYTALRTLKASGLIRFLRVKEQGERSTWESIGSPSNARMSLTRKPAHTEKGKATRDSSPAQKRPLINSIWALGTAVNAGV